MEIAATCYVIDLSTLLISMPRLICMNFKFAQLVLQTKLCFEFSARVVQYYRIIYIGFVVFRQVMCHGVIGQPVLENLKMFAPFTHEHYDLQFFQKLVSF